MRASKKMLCVGEWQLKEIYLHGLQQPRLAAPNKNSREHRCERTHTDTCSTGEMNRTGLIPVICCLVILTSTKHLLSEFSYKVSGKACSAVHNCPV